MRTSLKIIFRIQIKYEVVVFYREAKIRETGKEPLVGENINQQTHTGQ